MRRFDSLAQALRAFELVRIWEGQHKREPFGGAMLDRLDRTRRAADYLYRRVRRIYG